LLGSCTINSPSECLLGYSFLLPKFPMGRLGEPRDAAKLVVILASNESEWITGQIIHSDGGFW